MEFEPGEILEEIGFVFQKGFKFLRLKSNIKTVEWGFSPEEGKDAQSAKNTSKENLKLKKEENENEEENEEESEQENENETEKNSIEEDDQDAKSQVSGISQEAAGFESENEDNAQSEQDQQTEKSTDNIQKKDSETEIQDQKTKLSESGSKGSLNNPTEQQIQKISMEGNNDILGDIKFGFSLNANKFGALNFIFY